HWGGNWGYDISERQREFAHQLIDQDLVDVIFGHSSHHPMGMEVYKNKLIIYGAGDFINDYEGISGHEKYRGDLSLMYFPEINIETGQLISLKMLPMKIKNFSLHQASKKDVKWLEKTLTREGKKLGTDLNMDDENALWLQW
ncbi:CapA family protein, partial [Salegentibacter sp.]|uniref:CapA family protein n=1 Tax=Salegentibacter sp. TaxID=1903072 RepID=UPI003562F056